MKRPVASVKARYATNRQGVRIKLKVGDKAKPRPSRPVPLATSRCNDLERYFRDRYGAILPDDDAGRDDAEIMLNHIAYRQAVDQQWQMNDWLDRWAPWLAGEEREVLLCKVIRHPIRYTADVLARKIGLTYAKRERLGITTIGSIDVTAEQRKEIRKAKKREWKAKRRRDAGLMTRQEYITRSLNVTAPWEALGISRRTYYRRLKQATKGAKTHYAGSGLVPRVAYAIMTVRAI